MATSVVLILIKLFFLITLLQFLHLTTAQPPDFLFNFCINGANYTTNSTYQSNLKTLLSSLSRNSAIYNYGFYHTSVGQHPDMVNAIALCRGDVSRDICHSCISDATIKLREKCPNQKNAVGWYDYCMLRYSNVNIFDTVEWGNTFYMWNINNVTSVVDFNDAIRNLMERIRGEAAAGGSLRKFATGNYSGPDFPTIYGLMQCTPDLSEVQCSSCLSYITSQIPACCNGKVGGRVVNPSCNLRYETYRFYDITPPISSPGKSDNARTILLIVVPTIIVLMLFVVSIFIISRMKKRVSMKSEITNISTVKSLQYNFGTISTATDNFSEDNKLGQGGFGSVYKGRLQNGQLIAVKRLSSDSGQGNQEFKNEVLLLVKLQHKNLVRLLGFCVEGPERLLIYEFVPNASLDQFLFDSAKCANLNWNTRFKIIEGVARGLLYLHEDSPLKIVHRDLKASNILLDTEMNAKIADFGLARLFRRDESQCYTSRIAGTCGYMAPEYAMHGQCSVKSDVFSFGVLILEIVSGQKNLCFQNGEGVEDLLSYAWKTWHDGTASNMIDPTTLREGSGVSMRDIMRYLHIGLLCVQESVADRPTMASVVLMLSSLSLTIPLPSGPAFFMHSSISLDVPLHEEYSKSISKSGSFQWLVKKKSKHDINSWISL